MILSQLLGKTVELIISDPWEFQSTVGKADFRGEIRHVGIGTYKRPALMVQLFTPFYYKDAFFEFMVVESRLVGYDFDKLLSNFLISCGMTRISKEQAFSDKPLDTSWWRGGNDAFIGSIQLINH